MTFTFDREAVPRLPHFLHPSFWKNVIVEALAEVPVFDDELGIVWRPQGYFGDYHDRVKYLTFNQILTGIDGEITQNLRQRDNRKEQHSYLNSLSTYLGLDDLRIKAEERLDILTTYGETNTESERDLISQHVLLLNNVQSMIQAAYTWRLDRIVPTQAGTEVLENTAPKDGSKPLYAAIVYIEVAEYLDNAMDDKGKFLPDRNLGGTNDDHFRRYAEAIRSKFGVSFKGSTLEKDHGRRTKGLISTLQREQAYELLKRHAPSKTIHTYYLELKERQMKQFTSN